MKVSELLKKNVYAEDLNVGKIIDIVVDMEELKITHFELELSKEASEQVLGVTPGLLKPAKNILAVSAMEKGTACCNDKGVQLKVSKGQLAIYLRPT